MGTTKLSARWGSAVVCSGYSSDSVLVRAPTLQEALILAKLRPKRLYVVLASHKMT